MSGLIALAILIGWGWLVKVIVGLLAAEAPKKSVRVCIYIIGFPLIFIAPLADEIVAAPQVHKICREGSKLSIRPERAVGKTVKVEISQPKLVSSNTIVPIRHSHYSYKDVNSNEEVLSYNTYEVSGGWLSRAINFNGYNGPWIIGTSDCFPSREGELPKIYGFTLIN